MLLIKCDNCEKQIEAPDDAAGKKVKCPHCGDIHIVRPAGDVPLAKAVDPAAKADGLPPDSGPEQSVIKVRPEMFRARPLTFSGLFLGFLAGVVGSIYFGAVSHNSAMLGVSAAVGVVALICFAVWKVKNLASSLEITNKRTIERLGLFSRFTSEILHEDVRNVQISQSFRERLFGVGTIGISSAGQDGLEISVKDIRQPDRIRELIDRSRPM